MSCHKICPHPEPVSPASSRPPTFHLPQVLHFHRPLYPFSSHSIRSSSSYLLSRIPRGASTSSGSRAPPTCGRPCSLRLRGPSVSWTTVHLPVLRMGTPRGLAWDKPQLQFFVASFCAHACTSGACWGIFCSDLAAATLGCRPNLS